MRYQQIMEQCKESDRPEKTVAVIDTSGSMQADDWKPTRIEAAVEAVQAFLAIKCRRYPRDQVGLVSFCETVRIEQRLVTVEHGKQNLERALTSIETGMYTNIHAGLRTAGKLLGNHHKSTAGPLKILDWVFGNSPQPTEPPDHLMRIILLTDGAHNQNGDPVKLARTLKNQGIVIDCIGIGGDPEAVEEEELRQIATTDENGCHYWFIGDKHHLIKKFEALAGHLKPLED